MHIVAAKEVSNTCNKNEAVKESATKAIVKKAEQ
jgi:hypothetical protein